MSVGDEALDMLCFMKCYYRNSGICDQDMLLAALKYVGTVGYKMKFPLPGVPGYPSALR